MIKLLYIQASPQAKRSGSIAVADIFSDAKYNILGGKEHLSQEQAAWSAVESVVSEFASAAAQRSLTSRNDTWNASCSL